MKGAHYDNVIVDDIDDPKNSNWPRKLIDEIPPDKIIRHAMELAARRWGGLPDGDTFNLSNLETAFNNFGYTTNNAKLRVLLNARTDVTHLPDGDFQGTSHYRIKDRLEQACDEAVDHER